MSELKPCPFCGNTPGDDSHTLTDGGFKYGAISCGCGAVGPDVRTLYKQWPEWKDAAVAEWNERAIPADQVLVPRELLERIEESLRCEIEERYAGTKDHPAIRPKYLRDIAEADELRTLLHP